MGLCFLTVFYCFVSISGEDLHCIEVWVYIMVSCVFERTYLCFGVYCFVVQKLVAAYC